MNAFKLRNAALAAAIAAVAAGTAWATTEYTTSYSDLDADTVVVAEPVAETVTITDTVTTIEPAAAPAPETAIAPAPVQERSTLADSVAAQPPLTIEDRRLTPDQRIQALVMDKIALSSNISGKIGVESNDQVVTLTGYTVTAGQARRAGALAGSVDGVKYVQNEIRARIGGSV